MAKTQYTAPTRALLKFTITVDHEDRYTPVNVDVFLYREDGARFQVKGKIAEN